MKYKWWILGVPGLAGLAALAFYYWPENIMLRRCDAAIQATLKAPATFHRVDHDGMMLDGHGFYQITYDAANGFGVPLRSHGWCSVDWSNDKAKWVEDFVPES